MAPNGCRAPWRDRGAPLRRQIDWCDARRALPGSRQNADQGAERRGPDIWRKREPGTAPCGHRLGSRAAAKDFCSDCLFKPPPNVITEPSSCGIGADPDTRSTAGPAPACLPRPADGGRRCADQSPGWSRSPDRRHPTRASRLSVQPGWQATTACRGAGARRSKRTILANLPRPAQKFRRIQLARRSFDRQKTRA